MFARPSLRGIVAWVQTGRQFSVIQFGLFLKTSSQCWRAEHRMTRPTFPKNLGSVGGVSVTFFVRVAKRPDMFTQEFIGHETLFCDVLVRQRKGIQNSLRCSNLLLSLFLSLSFSFFL